MRKIPLYAYVASNNSRGAAEVIKHFGLPAPQSQEELIRGLRHVQSTFGKEGILEIAKAHPDRMLILATVKPAENTEEKSGCNGGCSCKEGKSNACGYSNANGNGKSSAEQELAKLKEEQLNAKIDEINKKSLSKEDIADEVKKVIDKSNPFIKNNLPYIALGGVALFFIYGAMKK